MAFFQKKNYVDSIEKHLYNRENQNDFTHTSHEFSKKNFEVAKNWQSPTEEEVIDDRIKKGGNIFLTIFMIAILFFAVSLGVAFYMFSGEHNVISEEEIELVVSGITQVASGVEFSLDVNVQNRSNAPLAGVELYIEYPSGTRSADGKNLSNEIVSIGEIASKSFYRKNLSQVLYGEEFTIKTVNIVMEYRLQGSTSVFKREKKYNVSLISTPVSIVVNSLNELSSGQDLELEIVLTSNSDKKMNNLLLQVDYPFGWTFTSANPVASQGNNAWVISELASRGEYKIKVAGKLVGTEDDLRKFQFKVGILDNEKDLTKVSALSEYVQDVAIKQPFLGLAIEWQSGVNSGGIINGGEKVVGNIIWTNNTNAVINDANIILNLSGNALNKNTVKADGGVYDINNDRIVWNSRDNSDLASVSVGKSGSLKFEFNSLDTRENSRVDLSLSVSGNRVLESGSQTQVASIVQETLKTATNISLASQVLHYSGPFETYGPMPPKVGQETGYTVVWTITNSRNDVSGVEVRAKIPSFVSWKNVVSPTSEKISFDQKTGEIVWLAGTVVGGSGFNKTAREVAFMIGLTPTLNQVGSSPLLLDKQTLSGTDSWTGLSLSDSRNSFTTWIINDAGFKMGQDIVAQ